MNETAYCGACGAQTDPTARFCEACGERQEAFAPPPPVNDGEPSVLAGLAEAVRRVEQDGNRAAIDGELAAGVYEAARVARDAGHSEEVGDFLMAARERAGDDAQQVFAHATLQENDREFREHGIEGLDIRRVHFTDGFAGVDDLDVACVATSAGLLVPKVERAGERVLLTIACELQLFVPNTLPDDEGAELHQRGFDHSDLSGSLAVHYDLRLIRRAAWGTGFLVLTDRRAIGLLISEDVEGVKPSPERSAMPYALVERDGSGSVLVFSIERGLFEDCEISTGLLQNRIPYVNLTGECPLAMQTVRIVDDRDRLVRPPKDAVANAVRAFVA